MPAPVRQALSPSSRLKLERGGRYPDGRRSPGFSRRNSLEVGFGDGIHENFLNPGISPKDRHLELKLSKLSFPEDCLPPIPGLGSSVLGTIPMRFPCIGSFIRGNSKPVGELPGASLGWETR
jgi:hypothetical protein